ncbi:hypothetical protein SAMN05660296_02035 [Pseudomonas sp. LAIL14HWK12:I8]|nr:hypothetical protein SAMN05660296_02035 [Pseudomonas sp. LAIL14HWK12:I8]
MGLIIELKINPRIRCLVALFHCKQNLTNQFFI